MRRLEYIVSCILTGIAAATIYGMLNDQATVSISREYFSVFKHQQFLPLLTAAGLTDAPLRLQAVLVGTAATWWFGMILGLVLGVLSSGNMQSPPTMDRVLRSVCGVMVSVAACAVVGGLIGYALEPFIRPRPAQLPFLDGIVDVRRAFAVGVWHDAAYAGGVIATMIAVVLIRRPVSQIQADSI